MLSDSERSQRLYPTIRHDQRRWSQRDRDRILFTQELRRLAGITQVVRPAEQYLFHNRLTHTFEVAQIARRLAERLSDDLKKSDVLEIGLRDRYEVIDPDVVEAAALAHDLGHPPFGHVAEKELDRLARKAGNEEGFEGNAQSFRIVSKLATHSLEYKGLNLSRATLNAILKYPWFRGENKNKKNKFGAYKVDDTNFRFARTGSSEFQLSLEASIMDYADAVAYAVHDLDDFQRSGMLYFSVSEIDEFFERSKEKIVAKGLGYEDAKNLLLDLVDILVLDKPHTGTREERAALQARNSKLISSFILAPSLQKKTSGFALVIPPERETEINFLKELLWVKVICGPQLATQQHGQKHIIAYLFDFYLEAVNQRNYGLVPAQFHEDLKDLAKPRVRKLGNTKRTVTPEEIRLAVDLVARLSEGQAQMLYLRLQGIEGGAITDLVTL